jgi:hypothetical protein
MTFIVRLCRDESGRLTGIVERVRTGEKERFEELATIATVIARMAGTEHSQSQEEDPR